MSTPLGFETRGTCPACSAPGGAVLTDLPFDAEPLAGYLRSFYAGRLDPARLASARYVLVDCPACRLVYQREVLDAPSLVELYSSFVVSSLADAQSSRGLDVRRQYSFQVEQVLKYFDRPPPDVEVLDFGGGWGLWLDMAAGYGCTTAVAELARDKAQTTSASGHRLFELDELPSARFDFVNAEQVFEHLTDPAGVLAGLSAALRPGGLLRLSVPNGANIRTLLDAPDWQAPKGSERSLNAVAPLEHVNCFSHESLSGLVLRTGEFDAFRFPTRQFLDPLERVRFVVSGLMHAIRTPDGTLLFFRKRGGR
ncbi:MAG: class I SAM-dependent methyltransferase [Acidimicrobiales bacterium]